MRIAIVFFPRYQYICGIILLRYLSLKTCYLVFAGRALYPILENPAFTFSASVLVLLYVIVTVPFGTEVSTLVTPFSNRKFFFILFSQLEQCIGGSTLKHTVVSLFVLAEAINAIDAAANSKSDFFIVICI